MMEQIKNYFNAEKAESLLFVLVGFLAIGISLYLLFVIKKSFSTGIAFPLIAISLIQIVVGGSVYFRSPKDIVRVEHYFQNEKPKIALEEIPRMQLVNKNFILYRYIEIALIVVGLLLMFAFPKNELLKGVGIGLFIQSSLMLSFDFFAEKRGEEYLQFLLSL